MKMIQNFLQNSYRKSPLCGWDVLGGLEEGFVVDPDRVSFLWNAATKRAFDVVLSFVLLAAASPLMVFLALLVKLDSKGPVFYAQRRVGVNRRRSQRRSASAAPRGDRRRHDVSGKIFHVLKFRSMRTDAEANGAQWCKKNDSRVTRVGAILRKTHLDELPQLINILRGDMSLVGPRPERPEFVTRLREAIPHYEKRLATRPGLTGLAQIRHRADLDTDDVKRKVRYDLLYIRKPGVWTDMKIVMGTVPLVFGVSVEKMRRLTRVRI